MPRSKPQAREGTTDERGSGPRPTWSGSLSFGLVTIPVELYPATRAPALHGHTVASDGTRLQRKYYCPEHDEHDLDSDDLVRGIEVNGKYVVVDDDELAALAPKKSREIELSLFTDRAALDPALFERSYVLAPGRSSGSGKAYALLVEVMHRQQRVGIATFVLREREYIIAVISDGRLLLGETLRFADEIRAAKALQLPAAKSAEPALVAKLTRALEAKGKGRFDPKTLVDPGHEALARLLEAKRKRGEVVTPPVAAPDAAAAEGGEVLDLMRLLKQSLSSTQPKKAAEKKPAPARAKKPKHARTG